MNMPTCVQEIVTNAVWLVVEPLLSDLVDKVEMVTVFFKWQP